MSSTEERIAGIRRDLVEGFEFLGDDIAWLLSLVDEYRKDAALLDRVFATQTARGNPLHMSGRGLLTNMAESEDYAKRSWPEDFAGENGRYVNSCCHCSRPFQGNKRRVTCKVCTTATPAEAPLSPPSISEGSQP